MTLKHLVDWQNSRYKTIRFDCKLTLQLMNAFAFSRRMPDQDQRVPAKKKCDRDRHPWCKTPSRCVPTDSQIAIAALPVGINKSGVYLLQPLVALARSAAVLQLPSRSRAATRHSSERISDRFSWKPLDFSSSSSSSIWNRSPYSRERLHCSQLIGDDHP